MKYLLVSSILGLTTDSLNTQIHEEILSHNAYPSTLNFQGFPKSIATSVNNVAAHGVPDSRPLEDGDIVTVDITVFTCEGFHGDCSQTYLVGTKLDKTARYVFSKETSARLFHIRCHKWRQALLDSTLILLFWILNSYKLSHAILN